MTTAHRPTWKAAVAKESGGWTAGGAVSTKRSVLDAPAHTRLKARRLDDDGDHGADHDMDPRERLKASLRQLEQAEQQKLRLAGKLAARRSRQEEEDLQRRAQERLASHTADQVDLKQIQAQYNDSDAEDDDDDDKEDASTDLDADSESDLDASSSDESDEDEDDEAALQAELAKIRAERDAARNKQEEERLKEQEEQDQRAALVGNPLLNLNASAAAASTKKRKWTEETVFRHQAKDEPKPQKRFINDTVRNDFHKRFLNKFIR